MMLQLRPCFIIFFISGFSMITGFLFILYPLLKNQAVCYFRKIIQKRKLNQEQLPGNLVME